MEKTINQQIIRVQEILKEIEPLFKELQSLFLSTSSLPKKEEILPLTFSVSKEILTILKDTEGKIARKKIFHSLHLKYPTADLNKGKVNSALVYLKNRQKITSAGRGFYKIAK